MAVRFTRKELETRNTKEDAVIVIDNVVYDVTQFLEDHPGGADVLLANAGADASECFRDVGHSDDALEWRRRFVVGEVVAEERRAVVGPRRDSPRSPAGADLSLSSLLNACAAPLGFAALAVFVYVYLFT